MTRGLQLEAHRDLRLMRLPRPGGRDPVMPEEGHRLNRARHKSKHRRREGRGRNDDRLRSTV